MKRKNMFTSAVIITLALSACISGCGKQDIAPVMAATVEQQTLTYEVTTEEESVIATESIQESSTDETETESVTVQDFTITEINKEMQATQNAMTYKEPNGVDVTSALQKDEIVTVIGIVDNTNWYQIKQWDETTSFIDSSFLKEPEQQQQQAQQSQDQTQQQPKAETPKENPPADNPQPPVVTPPADLPQEENMDGYVGLPDGGVKLPDGTEIHPGDTVSGIVFGGEATHGLY